MDNYELRITNDECNGTTKDTKSTTVMPQIRFKGFSDAWEEKAFDSEFLTNISTNSLSRDMLTETPTKIKNIHYGDVLIKYGEITNVQNSEIPFVIDDDINKFNGSFLVDGDIIFADAAEDETAGKATEIRNIDNDKIVSGLHTILARPINKFGQNYLGYYFNSNTYHNQLLPLMQGTKVLSINKSAMSKTYLRFPNEIPEQTAIGSFFKTLDSRIEAQGKKIEKLNAMKKALLAKMLITNAECGMRNSELNGTTKDTKSTKVMPQIRFKGFSDAWEEKELGDCLLVQRGGSPRPIEEYMTNNDNGINWIKIGDVSTASRYITKTKEKIKPEGENHSRKVFVGDLILSNSMSFGRPYIMQIEGCIHDGWLLLRDEKKAFNLEYLLELLSSDLMLDQYKALASGGVVNNLNSQLVQSTSLISPPFPNKKISGYFSKR